MANPSKPRLTKNERRELAREQARVAREQEKKREKRGRLFLQGGIVLGVLVILGIVALVLTQTMKPAGPGPENMASGGAVFTKNLEVVPGPALQPDADRVAPEVDRKKLPLDVTAYVDYMCPACGAFDQQYGTMLENYVGAGDVNLQVFPINFLDGTSKGSKYSTRAANAFSCVVEQSPDAAFKLHNQLLSAEVQPAEGTTGLTDDQLLEQAELAGAEMTTELKQCVKNTTFASFINGNWKQVSETGVLGLAKGEHMLEADGVTPQADGPQRLQSTPTVIVNGKQWSQNRDGDLESYLLKVKGEFEQKADSKKSTNS